MPANYRMLGLIRKAGYLVRSTLDQGVHRVTFRFIEKAEEEEG
jgi:hypothetical protein